jgi:hypothetical protein
MMTPETLKDTHGLLFGSFLPSLAMIVQYCTVWRGDLMRGAVTPAELFVTLLVIDAECNGCLRMPVYT